MVKPVCLNWHSIITYSDNLFKFRIKIARIMGKTAVVLIGLFAVFVPTQTYQCCPQVLDSPRIYSNPMLKLSAR